jgi:hypothetical protein
MKKKIFSFLLITALFITSFTSFASPQLAKENNDVSNLALMLPESDIILAVDMEKTLNVVGPSLLNQDQKKIENLKKLMKSLENMIGLDPYEIHQIVAGIKLPSVEEKDFLKKIDFTIIFRTAHSNSSLLEEWSKKIDAIEAFNTEKEPTEKYMDGFKQFRNYKLSQEETEKISKLNKEFEEILKKLSAVNLQLSGIPGAAKVNKSYKDSIKKNQTIVESINRFQTLLKKDAEVKSLRESSVKLQNRWYEISLEDPKRGEKLAGILKEAKEIYPNYKTRVENLARIDALINLQNYEFYNKLSKKSFGLPPDDFQKDPNEMIKEKLDEIIKTLNQFSNGKAKQSNQLKSISIGLQKLEDAMNIRLKEADEVEKFEAILTEDTTSEPKQIKSLSKSIKENAKISEVNGKRMITIDYEKISFWNPSYEIEEPVKETETDQVKTGEVKIDPHQPQIPQIKIVNGDQDKKDEPKKEEEKKELFAIGYLDEKTMILGFENGIRSILSRKEDYQNPKAAEMLSSFKNPLVSFATNSKIFQNFMKTFEGPTTKKEEKKATPTDKFFSDINVFGSVEYDTDNAATNDLIMSLGFTKNRVEDVFSLTADEEESSVFEVGDYQISKAIFYDLINTLKAFKASVSFKFEKKKVAALIESAPQIIEEVRSQNINRKGKSEKTKVQNFQNVEEILTSPKFYADLIGLLTTQKKK